MMAAVLFKASLLFILALGCLRFMRRASSAARHMVCACAMGGALVMPLIMWVVPSRALPIRLSQITFLAISTSASGGTFWKLSWVLLILWIVGTTVFLARVGIGYWQLAIVLRTAQPATGFFLADVSVPIVTGLLRPVILMPRAAKSWLQPQRAAALNHELAHVERRDLWTNLIGHLVCAMYWFNPLVWAVARHMRHEQETACDDAVLCAGFEPASYAEALVATAHQTASTYLIGCHMTQKMLTARIARLFEGDMPRRSSPATLRRTALIFGGVLAIIALLNGNPQAQAAPSKIYKIGNGVSQPSVRFKVDPEYTDQAHTAKIEGTVVLRVVIGIDGLAHDVTIMKSLDAGLDDRAVEAIQKWAFEPGLLNGEPVDVMATIEISFRLK